MTKEEAINVIIKDGGIDTNKISDGYHTFEQLYEHRIRLFIVLCKLEHIKLTWKSKYHSDGSSFDGWFIMGIGESKGSQITYHLPMKYWDEVDSCIILDRAPEWDGHTSDDVLERLKKYV